MNEIEAQETARWLWILVGCALTAVAIWWLGDLLGLF